MKYLIILIIMVLSGCSVIPSDFIKSASEVQADNDKYWDTVTQRRSGNTEVVQATEVITQKSVHVDRKYKLEVYPLGP